MENQLAAGQNLPIFLQRRIQFREAVVEDAAPTYNYCQKKKRKITASSAGDFIQASKELFPADRIKNLMQWPTVMPIGPGLLNLGNTCFLNSVLQCLTYTPPLANYLLSGEHGKKCRIEGFCLVCELEKHLLMSLGKSNGPRVIQPTGTVGHLKWISKNMRLGRQEDSHEFLRFMIEGMQRNFLAAEPKQHLESRIKETTLIHRIFGGYLQSQVKCLSCQNISRTFDPFLDLSLEVRQIDSISKALKQFAQAERLCKSNRYRCDLCGKLSDADKSMRIHLAPNILTIHLKRFNMSPFGEMSKINKHVEFSEHLDLSPALVDSTSSENVLYNLYAILVHEGQSCNSGHYHSFVKASNGMWYSMNDSSVHQVSLTTVLKQKAYLLFYIKSMDLCVADEIKAPIASKAIVEKVQVPLRDVLSPPATPDPEVVLVKQKLTEQETSPGKSYIVSNSMWHLSTRKAFRLEDFANLCQRLTPASKWSIRHFLK